MSLKEVEYKFDELLFLENDGTSEFASDDEFFRDIDFVGDFGPLTCSSGFMPLLPFSSNRFFNGDVAIVSALWFPFFPIE